MWAEVAGPGRTAGFAEQGPGGTWEYVGVSGPSGTVTFLFTDIEGSTRLWHTAPDAMRAALGRHDEILQTVVREHDGWVFSSGGDGIGVAFARPGAVAAAVAAQRRWWERCGRRPAGEGADGFAHG